MATCFPNNLGGILGPTPLSYSVRANQGNSSLLLREFLYATKPSALQSTAPVDYCRMAGEFIRQLTGFVSHPQCAGTPLRAKVFRGSTNSNVGAINGSRLGFCPEIFLLSDNNISSMTI